MTISRVVYVVESPLSARDHDRFGISVLAEAGFDVEVWEVQALFLPRAQEPAAVHFADCRVRSFTSLEVLVASSRALREDVLVILVCAVYLGELPRHLPLIRALMQGRSHLAAVAAGQRPPVPRQPMAAGGSVARVRRLRGRLSNGDVSIRSAASIMKSRLKARFFRSLARRHIGGFRELAWIWAGTDIDSVDPLFVGPHTRIRFIHTFDFDRILRAQTAPKDLRASIVYLDALGPLHPDFKALDISVEISSHVWFGFVNRALDEFAAASGLEVIIAAHPRAQPGSLDTVYSGKRVVHGQTESLIHSAKCVVISDPTTSIGMAAWHGRPITVVKCGRLFDTHQLELEQYADLLALEVLEPGRIPVDWSPPAVKASAYERFLRAYVKRPGTPTSTFWEVVVTDILSWSKSELDVFE